MITRQYQGEDKALRKILPVLFPELSYAEICALFRRKDVKVDGVRKGGDFVVSDGMTVSVYPRKKKEIKVVYEDENLLVAYKPKGIASAGASSFETVVKEEKGEHCVLMHRLDTNTDGVILFAKNAQTEAELFRAMKDGEIVKHYVAEVYGHPPAGKEISLRYYYRKDEEEKRAIISKTEKSGYLPVELTFKVIEVKDRSALLSVELHKGKMHQIRAMLAAYGYFILGDGKYGDDEVNRALGVKRHLLTAVDFDFHLPQNSLLSYLNGIRISL